MPEQELVNLGLIFRDKLLAMLITHRAHALIYHF